MGPGFSLNPQPPHIGASGPRKEGLGEGLAEKVAEKVGKGLAQGWRRVGKGLASCLAPSNFAIPEGARLEDRVCDSTA